MMHNRYMKQFLALLMGCLPTLASADELRSPDGRNVVNVEQVDGAMRYALVRDGVPIIAPSRLGLDMDNHTWERALARKYPQYPCWMQGFVVDSVSRTEHRDTISNLYGEQACVPDRYNQMTIHLGKHDGSDYRLDIVFRAYDEGVALRYFLPEHPQAVFHKVVADLTEYTFLPGTKVWAAEWAQAPYELKEISHVQAPIERAVTVCLPNGRYCALADADTDDWCLQKNVASAERPNTLATTMYSPVDIVTYAATPWKVVLTGDSYGQLLEHRFVIDNLNPPCAVADAAEWVRPGTIMRCTTLTTEAARRCIDFCAAHHIDYMLFDWKWYEPCTSHDGDATQVIPAIDMPVVVAYGRRHGVGIWLYVNQHALMRQARQLFPLLRQWGIVGVKSGFVQYASHRWAVWLHDLVRLAAEHHLMMNIHDEYRPTGFSRTYPNLLNQEGIRGNEEFPDATHNTILPFTRMLNGAADYTICYYDRRLRTTHGHQLAASLIYYAPLQTLFWYDRPEHAQGEPELVWFDHLPTVWDETRVLDGAPASHVVMARRSGTDWYVGAMTNTEARTLSLDTRFLQTPGQDGGNQRQGGKRKYRVTLYTDDPTMNTRTHVRVSTHTIKAGHPVTLHLPPSGGAALRFTPL